MELYKHPIAAISNWIIQKNAVLYNHKKHVCKDGDGIVFKGLPSETVVSVPHREAYENLGKAYAYFMQWVERNGYTITDNVRESYIDGIWNKGNEV